MTKFHVQLASAIILFTSHAYGQFQSYDHLYRNVTNAVNSGKVAVEPPTFDWDVADHMIYTLPKAECGGGSDPFEVVVAELIAVAAIHKYRCPVSPEARRFWHEHVFPKVDIEIRKMCDVAIGGRSDEEKRVELHELSTRVAKVYQSELDALAKRKGKMGAKPPTYPCNLHLIALQIPRGIRLKYMRNGDYLVWLVKKTGTLNGAVPPIPWDHPKWTEVADGGEITVSNTTRYICIDSTGRQNPTARLSSQGMALHGGNT